jgi:hypothetical protein
MSIYKTDSYLIDVTDGYQTWMTIKEIQFPAGYIYVEFSTVFSRSKHPTQHVVQYSLTVKGRDELKKLIGFLRKF